MQETISQKELEVQESEDKHKKYIEKAKNVIKSMDPKQVPSPMELNTLKNQLVERQKIITDLEVCFHYYNIFTNLYLSLLFYEKWCILDLCFRMRACIEIDLIKIYLPSWTY